MPSGGACLLAAKSATSLVLGQSLQQCVKRHRCVRFIAARRGRCCTFSTRTHLPPGSLAVFSAASLMPFTASSACQLIVAVLIHLCTITYGINNYAKLPKKKMDNRASTTQTLIQINTEQQPTVDRSYNVPQSVNNFLQDFRALPRNRYRCYSRCLFFGAFLRSSLAWRTPHYTCAA